MAVQRKNMGDERFGKRDGLPSAASSGLRTSSLIKPRKKSFPILLTLVGFCQGLEFGYVT